MSGEMQASESVELFNGLNEPGSHGVCEPCPVWLTKCPRVAGRHHDELFAPRCGL